MNRIVVAEGGLVRDNMVKLKSMGSVRDVCSFLEGDKEVELVGTNKMFKHLVGKRVRVVEVE